MKNPIRYPNLDDLAFEGRNKGYGAYDLRKRYSRRLLISTLTGISLFSILVLFPILLDYYEGNHEVYEFIPYYVDEAMKTISYEIPAEPPPATPATAPPVEKVPLVVDSVKVVEKVEDVKPEEEPQPTDTSANPGKGNNAQGAGTGDDSGIYTTIDVYPRYPGGDPARFVFLRSTVHYPDVAVRMGIQGVVVVVFVIEKNGSVSNVEISKGIGGGCDEEAIRVVKMMPLWDPGKRSGKAVRVLVRMPIVFRLPAKVSK